MKGRVRIDFILFWQDKKKYFQTVGLSALCAFSLLLAAGNAAAAPRAVTMPVRPAAPAASNPQSGVTPAPAAPFASLSPAAQAPAPVQAAPAAPAVRAAASPDPLAAGIALEEAPAEADGGKANINGFSSNPFALTHRDPPGQARQPNRKRLRYAPQDANATEAPAEEGKVVFSSGEKRTTDDRLVPKRTVFSSGSHTMGHFDEDPAREASVEYRMNGNATTRLTVNPQDEGSPLPRPPEPEGAFNSAGLYMDVEVQPNVKLRIGGEYCEIDDQRANSASETSRGASVGLKWEF